MEPAGVPVSAWPWYMHVSKLSGVSSRRVPSFKVAYCSLKQTLQNPRFRLHCDGKRGGGHLRHPGLPDDCTCLIDYLFLVLQGNIHVPLALDSIFGTIVAIKGIRVNRCPLVRRGTSNGDVIIGLAVFG